MGPLLLAVAFCTVGLQKPPSNDALYPDVPDNHFAYAMLAELTSDGLLPERNELLIGNKPLTRDQIGRFIVHGVLNLQQFVDDHRQREGGPGPIVIYSDTVSTFSGSQL